MTIILNKWVKYQTGVFSHRGIDTKECREESVKSSDQKNERNYQELD
jgi:hypothetical protein